MSHAVPFMKPGFSIIARASHKQVLFIIRTRTARLVGPALRNGEVENLIYALTPALFRYLGTTQYKLPLGSRGSGRVAHL